MCGVLFFFLKKKKNSSNFFKRIARFCPKDCMTQNTNAQVSVKSKCVCVFGGGGEFTCLGLEITEI